MLAVSHDRRVQVWHVGQVKGTVAYSSVTGTTEMTGFDGDIIDFLFTPDTTAIAVASLDGYVTIFDVSRPNFFTLHY
jgi:WD40 repeat protein